MAIIQCPRCHQRISDRALECPYCSAPEEQEPAQNPWRMVFIGVVIVIGLVLAGIIYRLLQ